MVSLKPVLHFSCFWSITEGRFEKENKQDAEIRSHK